MRHLRRRYRRGHSHGPDFRVQIRGPHGAWLSTSTSYASSDAANDKRSGLAKAMGIPISHTRVKMYLPGDVIQ